MPDQVRLIPARSAEWASWLEEAPHDFHHSPAHHLVWEAAGHGEAWLAVAGTPEKFLAWPYLLRRIPSREAAAEGLLDITSVDGYAGPLARGCAPGDPFLEAARRAIFERWSQLRVVSVFARFHPLLANQEWIRQSPACPGLMTPPEPDRLFAGLRHEGHTVSIDLRLEDAETHREYRETHRRHIRRARRAGLTVDSGDSPRNFHDFVGLYHHTMRRNQAGAHYYFSEEFLLRLYRGLAPRASIHAARLDGRTVAAAFITEYGGIVQYLLGGSSEAAHELSPMKLLLEDVRRWARGRGNHTFHLGGGRGCRDDDPLAYFKTGFSRRRHCFYTGRWILDQPGYDRLAGEAGTTDSSFFPAYRTPLHIPACPTDH